MTAWHALRATWILVVLLWLVTVPAIFVAIWTESDKLGASAAVSGTLALIGTVVGGMWASEGDVAKPLPRKERKKLEQAKRDAQLQRAIEDAEIEAGVREPRPDPFRSRYRDHGRDFY